LVVQSPKYDILLDQRLNWLHKCSLGMQIETL
jgi:hypothetical protein